MSAVDTPPFRYLATKPPPAPFVVRFTSGVPSQPYHNEDVLNMVESRLRPIEPSYISGPLDILPGRVVFLQAEIEIKHPLDDSSAVELWGMALVSADSWGLLLGFCPMLTPIFLSYGEVRTWQIQVVCSIYGRQ